jgi:hypothetical protein
LFAVLASKFEVKRSALSVPLLIAFSTSLVVSRLIAAAACSSERCDPAIQDGVFAEPPSTSLPLS